MKVPSLLVLFAFQFFFEEAGRVAFIAIGDLFWCTRRENGATATTTFRTHVDDVVCLTDNIEVMLDNEDGIATVYQATQYLHEDADVLEVQTSGGLVENIERGLWMVVPT